MDVVILEAFKIRDQFNAIKTFSVLFFASEVASFSVNFTDLKFAQYTFDMVSVAIAFLILSIFPDEENVLQRKVFLVFNVACILGGIAYLAIDCVLYAFHEDIRG